MNKKIKVRDIDYSLIFNICSLTDRDIIDLIHHFKDLKNKYSPEQKPRLIHVSYTEKFNEPGYDRNIYYVSYLRPETDEEMNKRLEEEKKKKIRSERAKESAKKRKKNKELKEREEYERLKKKFENEK